MTKYQTKSKATYCLLPRLLQQKPVLIVSIEKGINAEAQLYNIVVFAKAIGLTMAN